MKILTLQINDKTMFPCTKLQAPLNEKKGDEPQDVIDQYKLVFEDHFDGSEIDQSKWNTHLTWGPDVVINNEAQRYIDTNAGDTSGSNPFIHDNDTNLTIRASLLTQAEREALQAQIDARDVTTENERREAAGEADMTPEEQEEYITQLEHVGPRYSSGVIRTKQKFRYGYFELRAKVPCDSIGMWIAFWLLNAAYGVAGDNGKRDPEIDIAEVLRGPGGAFGGGPYDTDNAYVAYHYDDGQWSIDGSGFRGPGEAPGASKQCDGTPIYANKGIGPSTAGEDLCLDFHTFGAKWTAESIEYFLDGQIFASICHESIVSQVDMDLIINQAVGGNFPGSDDESTFQNGSDFVLDYVRVFQKA